MPAKAKVKLEALRTALAAQFNTPAYGQLLQSLPSGHFINISDTPLVKDCGVAAKVAYVARRPPLQHQGITLQVVYRAAVAVVDCLSGGIHFATLLVAPVYYRVRARGNHCSLSNRKANAEIPVPKPRSRDGLHYWTTSGRLLCIYQAPAAEA